MDANVLPLVAALLSGEPAPAHPAPPAQAGEVQDTADWAEQPSAEVMLSGILGTQAERNIHRGVSLRALLRCRLGGGGVTETCVVLSESPAGCGMGEAALKIAPKLRFTTTTKSGKPSEGTYLQVPLVLHGQPVDKIEPLAGCKAPS